MPESNRTDELYTADQASFIAGWFRAHDPREFRKALETARKMLP